MSYVDGFIVPVPESGQDAYRSMAETMGRKCKDLGALYYLEAVGDNLQHGKVTDFYMAVKAEEGENIVFSFIVWPDKATRDSGWEKLMADPDMQPGMDMPFDGKRMFWGGFNPIVEIGEPVAA
jgi:uncharacterized protein YbaA (DUF1428 family)